MENITQQETIEYEGHGPDDIWCKFGQHWADRSSDIGCSGRWRHPEQCGLTSFESAVRTAAAAG